MVLALVLPVLLTGQCLAERKRNFVLALWRHGARSPMEFSSQIGDTLETWPEGPGQLTQYGVELHQGKFEKFAKFCTGVTIRSYTKKTRKSGLIPVISASDFYKATFKKISVKYPNNWFENFEKKTIRKSQEDPMRKKRARNSSRATNPSNCVAL